MPKSTLWTLEDTLPARDLKHILWQLLPQSSFPYTAIGLIAWKPQQISGLYICYWIIHMLQSTSDIFLFTTLYLKEHPECRSCPSRFPHKAHHMYKNYLYATVNLRDLPHHMPQSSWVSLCRIHKNWKSYLDATVNFRNFPLYCNIL